MAGFKFTLAPVLEQRQAIEDKAQREYGAAQSRLEALRAQKREIEDEMASRKRQIREEQSAALPFYRRELLEHWIIALEHNLRELEPEIYRQIAKVEQLRLKLVKAMQDCTIMERLREQELRAWKQAEDRAERLRFDEIAIRNFAMEARERNQEKTAGCATDYPERIAG